MLYGTLKTELDARHEWITEFYNDIDKETLICKAQYRVDTALLYLDWFIPSSDTRTVIESTC